MFETDTSTAPSNHVDDLSCEAQIISHVNVPVTTYSASRDFNESSASSDLESWLSRSPLRHRVSIQHEEMSELPPLE